MDGVLVQSVKHGIGGPTVAHVHELKAGLHPKGDESLFKTCLLLIWPRDGLRLPVSWMNKELKARRVQEFRIYAFVSRHRPKEELHLTGDCVGSPAGESW